MFGSNVAPDGNYGTMDGLYIQGGGVVIEDNNGNEVFAAGGEFKGSRVINAGTTYRAVHHEITVVSGSWEVPDNKRWIIIPVQQDVFWVSNMSANVVGDIQLLMYSKWDQGDYDGAILNGGSSGYDCKCHVYSKLWVQRGDGTEFESGNEISWLVVEVPE